MTKTFYRVSNEETQQGLWYNMNGEFTGLIHDKFNFCKNNSLKMDHDPELKGYLSATPDLESLYAWFTKADILELQKHGYYIHEFKALDFKFYEKFQHHVINIESKMVSKIILVDDAASLRKELEEAKEYIAHGKSLTEKNNPNAKYIVIDCILQKHWKERNSKSPELMLSGTDEQMIFDCMIDYADLQNREVCNQLILERAKSAKLVEELEDAKSDCFDLEKRLTDMVNALLVIKSNYQLWKKDELKNGAFSFHLNNQLLCIAEYEGKGGGNG